jgi:hypothetical protein
VSDVDVAIFVVGVLGLFWVAYSFGVRRATTVINQQLQDARAERIERWAPPPPQPSGEPGSYQRLLSDFEDAVYAESRHALAAQYGTGSEADHAAIAAQLHADVRRLRGRVLDVLSSAAQT